MTLCVCAGTTVLLVGESAYDDLANLLVGASPFSPVSYKAACNLECNLNFSLEKFGTQQSQKLASTKTG